MQPRKVMLKIGICQTMRKHPFDHSIRKFPSISKQTNLLETKTNYSLCKNWTYNELEQTWNLWMIGKSKKNSMNVGKWWVLTCSLWIFHRFRHFTWAPGWRSSSWESDSLSQRKSGERSFQPQNHYSKKIWISKWTATTGPTNASGTKWNPVDMFIRHVVEPWQSIK